MMLTTPASRGSRHRRDHNMRLQATAWAVRQVHFLSVYFFSVYTRSTPVDATQGPRALGVFGGGNANLPSSGAQNNEGLAWGASISSLCFPGMKNVGNLFCSA